MLVPMTKVQIIGRLGRLEHVLGELHELRLVEVVDAAREVQLELLQPPGAAERASRREELRLLVAELDGLLDLADSDAETVEVGSRVEPQDIDAPAIRAEMDAVAPLVEQLTERIQALSAEEVVIARHRSLLRDLLHSVPELRLLDAALPALRLGTIVLVLGIEDERIVPLLREELRLLLGARFLLVSAAVEGGFGCVLLYPLDATAEIQELLAERRVRQLPLPDAYRDLSLSGSVEAMERRLAEIPDDVVAARAELARVLSPRLRGWRRARERMAGRLEQIDAVGWAGTTERAFVVLAWIPETDLERLRNQLGRRLDDQVVVEELPTSRRDTSAPVLMRNAPRARPFEFLVNLYDHPRARSLDPTGLIAIFVPLMFGLMVGDVMYGALLLVAALAIRAKFGPRSPVIRDGARVLAMGSVWAIVFGLVFGEFLGDLGERAFGMPAIWRHREEQDALQPLLLFAVAIGAAHVVLGYVLGLWQAWRDRLPRDALVPGGSLLVLVGLFAVAAVAAARLPTAALGPAAAFAIVGLVVISVAHGRLGLLLGPLELVGIVGHVLSYLRLAAVGLASVYLAVVANKLATLGPIWIGVVVAAFLHALNLTLAGFTPAIQSLRLQYVEFFSKFFIGGGRAFRPFGAVGQPTGPRSPGMGRGLSNRSGQP